MVMAWYRPIERCMCISTLNNSLCSIFKQQSMQAKNKLKIFFKSKYKSKNILLEIFSKFINLSNFSIKLCNFRRYYVALVQ